MSETSRRALRIQPLLSPDELLVVAVLQCGQVCPVGTQLPHKQSLSKHCITNARSHLLKCQFRDIHAYCILDPSTVSHRTRAHPFLLNFLGNSPSTPMFVAVASHHDWAGCTKSMRMSRSQHICIGWQVKRRSRQLYWIISDMDVLCLSLSKKNPHAHLSRRASYDRLSNPMSV